MKSNNSHNRIIKPIKSFRTFEEQIDNLIKHKGLMINDIPKALSDLESISYYALIDGYKNLFYDPDTRTYLPGTTIDDIRKLYDFDASLRDLIFSYSRNIEQHIRSLVSYYFTYINGVDQSAYLDPTKYYPVKSSRADVSKLIKILDYEANINSQHPYIVYQRKTYNNVPLWVLVNTLTFGQISRMYSLLSPEIKTKISRHFISVSERDLIQFLRVLTNFRNVCAHNERLFSYQDRYDIPDTALHAKLEIPSNGHQYIYGKKDLFAIIISFRYLLSPSDFSIFKHRLSWLITSTIQKSDSLESATLLKAMGMPSNWKKISRYKR